MNRTRPAWSRRADDYEALLRRTRYRFNADYCLEPRLRFADDEVGANPKRGIADHGPLENLKSKPAIRVGVVGTPHSIDEFSSYMTAISNTVRAGKNSRGNPYDPILFPDFPGTRANVAFRVDVRRDRDHERPIAEKLLEQDLKPASPAEQIKNVVSRIAQEVDVLGDLDPPPDVIAVVMPPFVQDVCQHVGDAMRRRPAAVLTPAEAFAKRMAAEEAKTSQGFFDFGFTNDSPPKDFGFWNFHHALKAHAMRAGIPTQLIWERSLRCEQTSQDPASIAWNLMTGLYYKAGNIPWEVEHLPPDKCFLGISFFKEGLTADASTQISLAQVFSGHGEGLVMKGGTAIKEPRKSPYMARATAQALVADALQLYAAHHPGTHARRLVVHKTSRFQPDEIAGIEAAVRPSGIHLDLVSLSTDCDVRILRAGTHPPLRGTYLKLSDADTLLFTSGYIPEFRQYPGSKNPSPLVIRHDHGDSTRESVCADIMALTKLNWNSSAYGSKEPITTLFAGSVGSILRECLAIPRERRGALEHKYRFYM